MQGFEIKKRGMKKRKWLIYTVLIGLIPFLLRFLIFIIKNDTNYNYILNEVDMVTFGLVLNLTNINELENLDSIDKVWKTTNIGLSVLMLILFASFLGLTYLADLDKGSSFNKVNIKYCALTLGLVSLVMSYSIYNRINSIA